MSDAPQSQIDSLAHPGPHCPNCDNKQWVSRFTKDGETEGRVRIEECTKCGWVDGDPVQLPQPQDMPQSERNRVEEFTFAILASPYMSYVTAGKGLAGAVAVVEFAAELDRLLTEKSPP